MTSNFELLKNKDILAILDGDTKFGIKEDVIIAMPYLSGADLCSLSTKFGLPREYGWKGGSPSRWSYLYDIVEYCIANNTIQNLLKHLFSKANFQQHLRNVHISKINYYYDYICACSLSEINKILYFVNKVLVNTNNDFYIRDLDEESVVETPILKVVDRDYIRGLCERASKDIDDGNFDSAITKCRTLIEEVFCYAVEQAGEEPTESGDIQKLYNQVKASYCMHTNKNLDLRINTLLSGLNKIISSIAEMRNENSDSHGVGNRRIAIEEYHARLILNATSTIAEFFLAVVNKKQRTLKTL